MNRIQKIKSYFIKYDFYSWKEFDANKYDLKFKILDSEMLLDIGSYMKNTLVDASEIGNIRHRLKEKLAIKCESLDELLPLIEEIISTDYKQTAAESVEHGWNFQYVVNKHNLCENTICVSNFLKSTNGTDGNCVYPVLSIRKFEGDYYCWNHLE